jgi:outer membrane protein assembly factor BamE (lipoprotein component of BamABCDE complex)
MEFVMKTLVATLALAAALAGCSTFGTHDPIVARDGFQEHPGTAYQMEAPGNPPLQVGPAD